MPTFTPPSVVIGCNDPVFSKIFGGTSTGQSIVKANGVFTLMPYPWLGDLVGLVEGTDWFCGGRTYWVTDAVGSALAGAGFTVDTSSDVYGGGLYGSNDFGEVGS